MHYVYKYVKDNEIIYIGKSDIEIGKRLKQHGKNGCNIHQEGWADINKAKIYYCKLPNSTMADVVESELIRRYKPKYNRAKTSEWEGLEFAEPKWMLYTPIENKPQLTIEEAINEIRKLKARNTRLAKENEDLQVRLGQGGGYQFSEKEKDIFEIILDTNTEDDKSSYVSINEVLEKYNRSHEQKMTIKEAREVAKRLFCIRIVDTAHSGWNSGRVVCGFKENPNEKEVWVSVYKGYYAGKTGIKYEFNEKEYEEWEEKKRRELGLQSLT